jgi:pectinesterase
MKKIIPLFVFLLALGIEAQAVSDNPDTLVVASDGSAKYRTLTQALEDCRVFMEYHKVIFVKKGVYKEKVIVPSGLQHIEIVGEDEAATVITWNDQANLLLPGTDRKMGTFRTFTMRIDASDITLRNLTIENNAPRLGQAVALHTEGDRLRFVHCRFLGNQDTVYTGRARSRLYFEDCYIEGTTDFIFGPATAWFENCEIHSKADSYVTAASTPQEVGYGYVFDRCRLTADAGITKVYLGRPWRPYSCVLYMHCTMGRHILPIGWDNWRNADNERTARYAEYRNEGPGAATDGRASWSRQLSSKEAKAITLKNFFCSTDVWTW